MITCSLQSLNCKNAREFHLAQADNSTDRPNLDVDSLLFSTSSHDSSSIADSTLFATVFDALRFHLTTLLDTTSICVPNRGNLFEVTGHDGHDFPCSRRLLTTKISSFLPSAAAERRPKWAWLHHLFEKTAVCILPHNIGVIPPLRRDAPRRLARRNKQIISERKQTPMNTKVICHVDQRRRRTLYPRQTFPCP